MESSIFFDSDKSNLPSKFLHRFYEPLGLLYALGKARGEQTHKSQPSPEHVDSLTALEVRRQFLYELAFLCDHEKGGDTVTAIGLQETPQGYIFWLAANQCPEKHIVPFLVNLLKILNQAAEIGNSQRLTEDIFTISVSFAHARIDTYARFLLNSLDKLRSYPACKDAAMSAFITSWEAKINDLREENPHALVKFAYNNRHSEFVQRLNAMAHGRHHTTSADSLQATCTSTRHAIGRLGLHVRSARVLSLYTPRTIVFLDNYSVQAIPVPVKGIGRPPPRNDTNLERAMDRMIGTVPQSDFQVYRQALRHMDEPFKISERFRMDYGNAKNKTRVHAELQVLDHFDQRRLNFAEGDKYIACSKPACFCCHLYFRHHPGGFIEPQSHQKIYLNWQPPGLMKGGKTGLETQVRGILDLMIKDIRRDALRQLMERAGPRIIHPDSITGISSSVPAAPRLDAIPVLSDDEEANVDSDYSSFDSDNVAASSSRIVLVGMATIGSEGDTDDKERNPDGKEDDTDGEEDDTDTEEHDADTEEDDTDGEEGGVSLLGTEWGDSDSILAY